MNYTNTKESISMQKRVINKERVHSSLLKTSKVRLNRSGMQIRYAELGDKTKPVVMMLHGVPENLQCWYAAAPLLAKKYHVIAIDWPGFGGSDPFTSADQYNSKNFAKVIIDFMDTLNISKANLVATDIALLPALLVGLENPERVIKLAVMDGIPFSGQKHSSWELRSFSKKGSILGKALVNWFPGISAKITRLKGFYFGNSIPIEIRREFLADGLRKSNQEAFLSYFQNFYIGQEYFEHRANELKTPVQVIWGKNDRFINVKLAHEIANSLPNAQLNIIEKCGHYIHMDKPKELVQVITEFLNN